MPANEGQLPILLHSKSNNMKNICVTDIMKRSACAVIFALSFNGAADAQDFPFQLLSNDLIWSSGEFRGEYVSGVRSMNDGKHYTSLERSESGSSIVKYAYRTGEAVDTIATSLQVFQDAGKGFNGYEFSADESNLLITTETEGIYRHSFFANYYTHNLETGITRPLSDFETGKQRLAAFSPDAKQVAFVRDNNVFIVDLESGEKRKSQRMASAIKSSMAPPIGCTRKNLERTMVFFGPRTANSSLFTDSTNPVSRSFPCRCMANFTPSHTPSNTQKQEKTMQRSMSLSSIPKRAEHYPCSIQKQNTFRG